MISMQQLNPPQPAGAAPRRFLSHVKFLFYFYFGKVFIQLFKIFSINFDYFSVIRFPPEPSQAIIRSRVSSLFDLFPFVVSRS